MPFTASTIYTITLLGLTAISSAVQSELKQKVTIHGHTLFNRQIELCRLVPAPATCEQSCGSEYAACLDNCYNPIRGEACCLDGTYCPAGTYCALNRCCDNSLTLKECDRGESPKDIPPPKTPKPSSVAKPTNSPCEPLSLSTQKAPRPTGRYPTVSIPLTSSPALAELIDTPTNTLAGSNSTATYTATTQTPKQTKNAATGVSQRSLGGVGLAAVGLLFAWL
ncbi:hypothetical protein FQN57_001519 [Myotisia sp. PD_48]|nr:hypothetical protein FQN57_001519 [Myotisia sp. PD_48]